MSKKTDNDMTQGGTLIQIKEELIGPSAYKFVSTDLPILSTRNLVLFPGVSTSISIGRPATLRLAKEAYEKHLAVGIFCQVDPNVEQPFISDLYDFGVLAHIMQIIDLPDGNHVLIAQAVARLKLLGPGQEELIPGVLSGTVRKSPDRMPQPDDTEFSLTINEIERLAIPVIEETAPERINEFKFTLQNQPSPIDRINFLSTNLPLAADEKYTMLSVSSIKKRAELLLGALSQKIKLVELSQKIREKAKTQMTDQQRQAFLMNQMDAIQTELYGETDASEDLLRKAKEKNMPEAIYSHFEKETRKLSRLNPQSPDYAVLQSYLETLVALPWTRSTTKKANVIDAMEQLNNDHYGLEKVKERIVEQIALLVQNPDADSPIICLVGPPGVGKTSLGRSIADALGREYQRVSFGGLHDEAEIRGHRRTYIGAMPGRIINALRHCDTTSPLLLLDEIDKIGNDYKGDPSAALLEVLDPEQHKTFHDNYIDVDYDLSDVLFVCTANTTSTIPAPLLDRMEIIDIPGYLLEEKIQIAIRHLIPRELKRANMEGAVEFTSDGIRKIIESYTAESGVRQLAKEIAAVIRKVLYKKLLDGDSSSSPVIVDAAKVTEILGVEKFVREPYGRFVAPGVVPGLAWTSIGGELLYIEALLVPGKGDNLSLTGNLGNVMKESASIAWQVIRSNAVKLGISKETLEGNNLHIHAPEGAVPKDGPSAGITIATAIASAYLGQPIKKGIAMTGELTLSGNVLPVGGIREKILAAKRHGISTIILSERNRRNIEEIQEEYRRGMNFIYVETVWDVLNHTLSLPKKS